MVGFDDEFNITQVSPYYRIYFGKKYAAGFFVEAFMPITSTKEEFEYPVFGNNYTYYKTQVRKGTSVGAGIGFGGKWIAKRNIIFEASFGVARRFGNGDYDKITGIGMLGIGHRF